MKAVVVYESHWGHTKAIAQAVTADPCVQLERKVSRRVFEDGARRVVASAVTEVAQSAMHPARHFGIGLSASGGMLEGSIERATQAALETLVDSLSDLVEFLPCSAIEQLAREQVMAEQGLE